MANIINFKNSNDIVWRLEVGGVEEHGKEEGEGTGREEERRDATTRRQARGREGMR